MVWGPVLALSWQGLGDKPWRHLEELSFGLHHDIGNSPTPPNLYPDPNLPPPPRISKESLVSYLNSH
jgi:hypothetical protein